MIKQKYRIILFHCINFIFLCTFFGIDFLQANPEKIFDYYILIAYVEMFLYAIFLIVVAIFLSGFVKQKKNHFYLELLLLDLPALLMSTYSLWRRYIYNLFDHEKHFFIRAFMSSYELEQIWFLLGCLIIGVEMVRFYDRYKNQKIKMAEK